MPATFVVSINKNCNYLVAPILRQKIGIFVGVEATIFEA